MKKLMLITLTCLVTVVAAAPALALGPVDHKAELPLYSKYVWRGMTNVDDFVLQPSVEAGLFGFTLSVWGNLNLTDVNGTGGDFGEVDYKLGYGLGLAILELGAGFIHYNYPKIALDNTNEFFIFGKANVLLSPTLYIYQDIDKYHGGYWEARVGHGFGVGESTQIDLTAGLGLGSQNYIQRYFPVDPNLE